MRGRRAARSRAGAAHGARPPAGEAVMAGSSVIGRNDAPRGRTPGEHQVSPSSSGGSAAAQGGPGLDPVVLVHAGRVSSSSAQSSRACSSTRCRPSTPRRSRASGSQCPGESSSAASQASWLVGASPKYTVAWALASGDIMWFIHMYMQFGCAASEAIIQVSDQPVVPSAGLMASTGAPSAWSELTWNCQVVPTTTSPAGERADLLGEGRRPVQRSVGQAAPRAARWPHRTAPGLAGRGS